MKKAADGNRICQIGLDTGGNRAYCLGLQSALIPQNQEAILLIRQVIIVSLVCLGGVLSTEAKPNNAEQILPNTLNCASDIFEPYVIEQQGRLMGINVQLATQAAQLVGINIKFVRVPWLRLEGLIEQQQFDCVVAYFKTPEREHYMHFTNVPIQFTSYNFFVREGRVAGSWQKSSVKGWQIGYHRGFKLPDELQQWAEQGWVHLIAIEHDEQALGMVMKQRLDALITNRDVGLYLLKKNQWQGVAVLEPALSFTPAFLVFAKTPQLAPLVPKFDKALFTLLHDGSYELLRSHYGIE